MISILSVNGSSSSDDLAAPVAGLEQSWQQQCIATSLLSQLLETAEAQPTCWAVLWHGSSIRCLYRQYPDDLSWADAASYMLCLLHDAQGVSATYRLEQYHDSSYKRKTQPTGAGYRRHSHFSSPASSTAARQPGDCQPPQWHSVMQRVKHQQLQTAVASQIDVDLLELPVASTMLHYAADSNHGCMFQHVCGVTICTYPCALKREI